VGNTHSSSEADHAGLNHQRPTIAEGFAIILSHKITLIADALGALGFFSLANTILHWIADKNGQLFGVDAVWWTSCIGLALFAVVFCLAFYELARITQKHSDRLVREGKEKTDQLTQKIDEKDAEIKELLQRPTRYGQKRAMEAMRDVYGYSLDFAEYAFTIKPDGSAEGKQALAFRCGRRSLGSWSRIRGSNVQPQPNAKDSNRFLTSGFTFQQVDISPNGPKEVKEVFTFSPTLSQNHGPVHLELNDRYDEKSFLCQAPNDKKRDYDWVSASVREPVSEIRVQVFFEGFKPHSVEARAVYGPHDDTLHQEENDCRDALATVLVGTGLKAELKLPYPVMGVRYEIKWKLPQAVIPAPAALQAQHQSASISRTAAPPAV
jgi:hypothetical protein